MKKHNHSTIIMTALVCLSCLLIWTSCADDRDSNPVLKSPSTFTLHKPAFAEQTLDLLTSKHIRFDWQYPDYGFPMAVKYALQFSVNGKFDKAFDPQVDSNKQQADYVQGDSLYSKTTGLVNAHEMAVKLQQIAKYKEGQELPVQQVFVRAQAFVSADTIYSNVISIRVAPYYVELKDAPPVLWYLVGECIGDGKWNNAPDAIGKSLIPMYPVEGNTYDKKTGKGEIQYLGYFPKDKDFKIIEQPGNWDYGICGGDEKGGQSYRSGGNDPGNIRFTKSGYYLITVNTETHACTITPKQITPKEYNEMALPGTHNEWSANALMQPVDLTHPNHVWKTTITLKANGEVKFRNGQNYWGAMQTGFGVASPSIQDNIPVDAGTYDVYFYDLSGNYQFISK